MPVSVESVTPEQVAEVDVGPTLQKLRFRNVIFVHGTFVGDDPFGLAQRLDELAESLPAMLRPALKVIALDAWGRVLRAINRQFSDKMVGEVGSFRNDYLADYQRLVGNDVCVERFDWSSGNNHLSRAIAATELFCRLNELRLEPGHDRVLLWGHSHAGNVFALLTNLLANDRDANEQFFQAGGSLTEKNETWREAREQLQAVRGPHPLSQALNIVTCGTPVRYGWDRDGYSRLLHICHHRPVTGQAPFLAKPALPQLMDEIVQAKFGDWVQSLGVAGTDLRPIGEDQRASEFLLGQLLEAGLDQADVQPEQSVIEHLPAKIREQVREKLKFILTLLNRWRCGSRVPADGDATWLFDYGSDEIALFGHGVYTKRAWLPFHATRIAEWLRQTWES